MGDDFSSLLEYRGIDAAIERIITRLESGFEPPELTRVVDAGVASGFAFANRRWRVGWYDWEDFDKPVLARPRLPDLRYPLGLQSGFFLTFGRDSIWVYHLLRWQTFWQKVEWHNVMVPAVRWFRAAFGATDAVITWDASHLICQFHADKSFDRALAEAISEGETEVDSPSELCWLEEQPSDRLVIANGKDGWAPTYTRHNRGWWRP